MTEQGDRVVGLAGLFDSADELLDAARVVSYDGHRRWDCHTPYPVHGLDEAMALQPSPIPYLTIGAGFAGLATAIALTGGLNTLHYPILIGGKALFSWQAYVPIFFEMFVLFAGITTLLAVFFFCRLFRWHSPLHDSGIMEEVTCDRFAIVLNSTDENYIDKHCRPLLERAGCADIRLLVEAPDDEPTL